MGAKSVDRLAFERGLWQRGLVHVAGVDEAGRGPLAGPVVAAAVVLPYDWLQGGVDQRLQHLNDSKQLSEAEREHYFGILTSQPEIRFGLARVEAGLVDQINILQATHQAMNEALDGLKPPPTHVLVDGMRVPSMRLPQTALVKGDARSYSIAAASVLAKVTRDRIMIAFDLVYPAYGFAVHKGYATPGHLAALAKHGPCPIHRRSFAPLRFREQDLFEPS